MGRQAVHRHVGELQPIRHSPEVKSILRRQLLIFFLHRSLLGVPDHGEEAMIGIYITQLKKMNVTPEQIAADINAIRREAGLG